MKQLKIHSLSLHFPYFLLLGFTYLLRSLRRFFTTPDLILQLLLKTDNQISYPTLLTPPRRRLPSLSQSDGASEV
jgi:hypothetical protein